MKENKHDLFEKYLNNLCTKEEAQIVLEWIETPEGESYLRNRLEKDIQNAIGKPALHKVSDDFPDYQKMLSNINAQTQSAGNDLKDVFYSQYKQVDYWLAYMKVAAFVAVVLTASLFYFFLYNPIEPISEEVTEIVYTTDHNTHKNITLSDGSVIQINANSRVSILEIPDNENRFVTLQGEAFFNVVHNPNRKFSVLVNDEVVEVLGTEFNVRSENQEGLYVTVLNGSVSLSSSNVLSGMRERRSVVLKEGQSAIMDFSDGKIHIEDSGAENFLVWKTGRWVFDDLTLENVCRHLERNYGSQCEFLEPELKTLRVSSRFSNESLENTVSVIAQTLQVHYRLEGRNNVWISESESPSNSESVMQKALPRYDTTLFEKHHIPNFLSKSKLVAL